MEFYNELLALSNRVGCTVPEAFSFAAASFIIFLALFSWSICFFMDCGERFYMVSKTLFILLRKALRKVTLFLLPKLHRP